MKMCSKELNEAVKKVSELSKKEFGYTVDDLSFELSSLMYLIRVIKLGFPYLEEKEDFIPVLYRLESSMKVLQNRLDALTGIDDFMYNTPEDATA